MTTPENRSHLGPAAVAGLLLVGVLGVTGCGGNPPPPAPVTQKPAPPPSPPPKPTVTPINQLMAELGIDQRVQLSEADAPETDAKRRAVLEFFDSFARGDAQVLGSMLAEIDRMELDDLVASGVWETTTADISRIVVQTGEHAGESCALAVFWVGAGFQPQLWVYTTGIDKPTFDAIATPPDIMSKLSGDDWIAAWFKLLNEELALANKLEEEFIVPKKDLSDPGFDSGFSMSPGGPPTRQPGSPGPGKRPKPKGPPRRPPGPP